jgi:hypothetical protein
MIDSMIYDEIAAVPGLRAKICRLIDDHQLDLIASHVQQDEIAATLDEARRRELMNVPISETVPTSVFVLDVSRLGMAQLGEPQQRDLDYEALAGPNRVNAKDVEIALTALNKADVLVTKERRLQSQLVGKGLPVWTFDPFREWWIRSAAGQGDPMPTLPEYERLLRRRLDALPLAARAEFLHVLMLPDFERAARIGEFWSYPQSRSFGELLIDLEQDRTARALVIGMLREANRLRPSIRFDVV